MTGAEHRRHMARVERIRAALVAAQHHRDRRQDLVDTDTGRELGWVIHEREVAWRAANDERARLGLGPIPLTEVERVERMACGHVDYTAKFALYVADLVIDS